MAALSFKGRFVELIQQGKKKQTIRNFRKYPIKAGETLYLYYGMRTKHCTKIGEEICKSIQKVTISTIGIHIFYDKIPRPKSLIMIEDVDAFAQADGFKDWEEMKRWWSMTHELPFTGQLIKW